MKHALTQLAELVEGESGIRLDHNRHALLSAAAKRVAGGRSVSELVAALASGGADTRLLPALIDEITVNETFFFRQAEELRALNWRGLEASAHARGSALIRVWVAGCSSGEEAYTLAMLASESFAPQPAPLAIVATDISESILCSARCGQYSPRATRGVTAELRQRYFEPAGKQLAVGERLRRLVTFERHNLVRDQPPRPAPFELITCRNTLIYFDGDTSGRVLDCFARALAPGGTLILGAADRITVSSGLLPPAPRQRSAMREREGAASPRRRRPPPDVKPQPTAIALQAAADAGRIDEVLELSAGLLAQNPLDAEVCFIRGLAELGAGDAHAAVASLRRAVYARPGFGVAAFKLGRALELCGERGSATQAYRQALHALVSGDERDSVDSVTASDIAAACRLRIRALS